MDVGIDFAGVTLRQREARPRHQEIPYASGQHFLRFLCETVRPAVRPDVEEARDLADAYNNELSSDGWSLVEGKHIAGKPVFVPQKLGQRMQILPEPTGWQKVDQQLQEVRLRLDTARIEEQYQAVGLLCREALITVA